jgi:hypothetical protein
MSATTNTPNWLLEALQGLAGDSMDAEFAPDPGATFQGRVAALRGFADTMRAHDAGGRQWFTAAWTLATVARRAQPDTQTPTVDEADHPPYALSLEDQVTGEMIGDPDAEVADEPHGAAVLAALRFFVAVGNDDTPTAQALLDAVPDDDLPVTMMVLTQMAGTAMAESEYRAGHLSPERAAQLELRMLQAQIDAPPVAEHRTGPDGSHIVALPRDPRDADIAPSWLPGTDRLDGATAGLQVFPRLPGYRDRIVTDMHARMAAQIAVIRASDPDRASDAVPQLCGVPHWDEVEVHQLPHTVRRGVARQLRQSERETGQRCGIVRVWQHTSPCPESLAAGAPRAAGN